METTTVPLQEAARRAGIASTATDFARYLQVHEIPTTHDRLDLSALHGAPTTAQLDITFTEIKK